MRSFLRKNRAKFLCFGIHQKENCLVAQLPSGEIEKDGFKIGAAEG